VLIYIEIQAEELGFFCLQ